MTSIRRYKPQLLDPALGDSEEDKLRLKVKELEEKLAKMDQENKEVRANLEDLEKKMETKGELARVSGMEEAVRRVVKLHNFLECCDTMGGDCNVFGDKMGMMKEGYGKVFAKVEDCKEVEEGREDKQEEALRGCLLYTSPSPRDQRGSRMPSSA